MKKQQLQEKLIQNHAVFTDFIRGLSDVLLNHAMPGKWTPIQQMSHIWKSVAPVKLAFSIPKFALGILFGKANRPSRSYEELVARYNEKLSQGGKTTPRYLPDVTCDRILLQDGLEKKVKILCDKIERFSEEELDEYVLPHPLLGKITLREMIYFTIHHVQHHHAQVNASFRFATVLA